MTEQQQRIMQLVANHKQYTTLEKELEKCSYEPIHIVPQNYIQVFDDSLLNIAKLFGKRIEWTVDDMEYDCHIKIEGVDFTALLNYDFDSEADCIDDIIEYMEEYNDYFSIIDGEFIPTLHPREGKRFFVQQMGGTHKLARIFEEDDHNSILIGKRYKVKSFYDFCDEVVAQNNECAMTLDSLIDGNGKKYLIWGDSETNETFITEYKEA